MLQYLIILLDDTATSFCHYGNRSDSRKLISIEDLKAGIFFAMKENLMIQFVYPDYELPGEYKDVINTIDHSDIVSCRCEDKALRQKADVVVINDWTDLENLQHADETAYVLRTTKSDLFDNYALIKPMLSQVKRLNVVVTDVDEFAEEDFARYQNVLSSLSEEVERLYANGQSPVSYTHLRAHETS